MSSLSHTQEPDVSRPNWLVPPLRHPDKLHRLSSSRRTTTTLGWHVVSSLQTHLRDAAPPPGRFLIAQIPMAVSRTQQDARRMSHYIVGPGFIQNQQLNATSHCQSVGCWESGCSATQGQGISSSAHQARLRAAVMMDVGVLSPSP